MEKALWDVKENDCRRVVDTVKWKWKVVEMKVKEWDCAIEVDGHEIFTELESENSGI